MQPVDDVSVSMHEKAGMKRGYNHVKKNPLTGNTETLNAESSTYIKNPVICQVTTSICSYTFYECPRRFGRVIYKIFIAWWPSEGLVLVVVLW